MDLQERRRDKDMQVCEHTRWGKMRQHAYLGRLKYVKPSRMAANRRLGSY